MVVVVIIILVTYEMLDMCTVFFLLFEVRGSPWEHSSVLTWNKADLHDAAEAKGQKCVPGYLGGKLAVIRERVGRGLSLLSNFAEEVVWQTSTLFVGSFVLIQAGLPVALFCPMKVSNCTKNWIPCRDKTITWAFPPAEYQWQRGGKIIPSSSLLFLFLKFFSCPGIQVKEK